jgi:hypothetical protein
MPKQGPNFSDDPRLETVDPSKKLPKADEMDRRNNRYGIDLLRTQQGLKPKYSIESKVPFVYSEAQRIQSLIKNSDLGKPYVKLLITNIINNAFTSGVITEDESKGLLHYLEHAEGFSDERARDPDWQEIQAGDY